MECEKWKSGIMNNLVYITQSTTNLNTLMIHLIQNKVISPNEKEKIESHNTLDTQVYHLMMLLTRKSPKHYNATIDALGKTGNDHISDIIIKSPDSRGTEFSKTMIMDLSSPPPSSEQRINPLLEKVEENLLRLDDIIEAAKSKLISIKEVATDGEPDKKVHISQVPISPPSSAMTRAKSIKMVIVGDGCVGKTCMNIVWTTGIFPQEYLPTVFDNYETTINFRGNYMDLSIWDTAGQEQYDRLRPLSYPTTDVFVLTFAVSDPSSFENIRCKWLPEVRHHQPRVPIVLIGNKIDLRPEQYATDRNITPKTLEEGKILAFEIGACAYFECSAFTGEGMKNILEGVLKVGLGLKKSLRSSTGCCKTA